MALIDADHVCLDFSVVLVIEIPLASCLCKTALFVMAIVSYGTALPSTVTGGRADSFLSNASDPRHVDVDDVGENGDGDVIDHGSSLVFAMISQHFPSPALAQPLPSFPRSRTLSWGPLRHAFGSVPPVLSPP